MKIKFNWQHIILAVIIAVFFLMFLVFGTNLVSPGPEYEDFCDEIARPVKLDLECRRTGNSKPKISRMSGRI